MYFPFLYTRRDLHQYRGHRSVDIADKAFGADLMRFTTRCFGVCGDGGPLMSFRAMSAPTEQIRSGYESL